MLDSVLSPSSWALENKERIQRYHSLDKLKVLCSFLVVCVHAPFPGEFGAYYLVLTRIAVAVFFMISGYFWNDNRFREQIRKLLKLLVFANALYFIVDILKAVLGNGIKSFLQSVCTPKSFMEFIFLNVSPFAVHLWYLGAIIYVLIIYHIMEKAGIKKYLIYLTPLLLLGNLLLGKYSLVVFHREFPYIIARSWLFVGIPYFAIGHILHEKEEWIRAHVKKILVLGGVLLFAATSLLERYLLVLNSLNAKGDHYISSTFLAIMVFLLFRYYINNEDSFTARIGRDYSTWIYIFHYLVIHILDFIMRKVGIVEQYSIIRPVIVFLITTAAVAVIGRIVKKKNLRLKIRM